MTRLRVAVCASQGWETFGAFPKIAAVLPQDGGGLYVRAVSVPSWHPTVALTGAICLGAAAGITGTVPWSLAGARPGIPTRCSRSAPRAAASGSPPTRRPAPTGGASWLWVSVAEKQVEYRGLLPRPRSANGLQPSADPRLNPTTPYPRRTRGFR